MGGGWFIFFLYLNFASDLMLMSDAVQPNASQAASVPAVAPQVARITLPRTSESETLKKIRHTTSHVMAMAVQKLFPKVQVTIGLD
jgi:threonyl-tRNA synthetase